jgi:hypothetical protein
MSDYKYQTQATAAHDKRGNRIRWRERGRVQQEQTRTIGGVEVVGGRVVTAIEETQTENNKTVDGREWVWWCGN